ncbi:hypothetical protein [Aneurinibacillus aneurinilyticus]|uniref:hypothetical protein n=1 Tax=Aneurinibacillus aneurinilyticus TaxID=1391 RepID=UPI0035236D85
MIIHKVEERRCTRRRVPSSFSHKEETRPLCGARARPAKHLSIKGAGDSCRSISSLAPHAPHSKENLTGAAGNSSSCPYAALL